MKQKYKICIGTFTNKVQSIKVIRVKNLEQEFRKNIFPKTISISQKLALFAQSQYKNQPITNPMHYTQSEFRRVEHQFLQQFEFKTQEFYDQNVNGNNIIEYKKILNQIKTKRNQAIQRKQKCQWLHKRGKTIDLSGLHQSYNHIDSSRAANQSQKKLQQQQTGGGFYITDIWRQTRKKNATLANQQKQISVPRTSEQSKLVENSRTVLIKSRAELMASEHPENENLNIENLNDRIYGQYSVLQCLQHEESQVQQAIFCFKKRIIAMEEQLNSEDIKSKEVDRLLSENINEMMRAKHTNQQVKSMFLKTKKHFDLDLQGRKQIQLKFGQKNKQEFDESIVNHIYLKKMKHHIAEQQKQLQKLNLYRHELQKKEKKYQSIYLKEQQLYKTYEQIKAIQNKELNKKPIVSILDKDFQEFDSLNSQKGKSKRPTKTLTKQDKPLQKEQKSNSQQQDKDKSLKSNEQQQKNTKKKLSMVVKDIVELYRRMKYHEGARINQFKQLINQRDQKQAEYTRTISKLSDIYQAMFEQTQPANPEDKQKFQQLRKQINQITNKRKFLSLASNGIESRLKYYLGKQLAILRKIINTWMKSDKLAAKYVQTVALKLHNAILTNPTLRTNLSSNNSSLKHSYDQVEERELSIDDSRNLLTGCFENWQEYLGFLDIIHDTSFIYRFMTKPKLFRLFKRVIKTKLNNREIPTDDIFEKALAYSFDEGRTIQTKRIQNLLHVFRDIFAYLTKVANGSIRLNCAVNYDLPIQVKQPDSTDHSKAPSRDQLQRFSSKKQLNVGVDRVSLGIKNMISSQNKKTSDSRKIFFAGNMKDEDVISKLKKKKHYKTQFNIHEFYEDLREEIEKVNKISVY